MLRRVTCADGKSYVVMIANDAEGSTSILECSMLTLVSKVECFKPNADPGESGGYYGGGAWQEANGRAGSPSTRRRAAS